MIRMAMLSMLLWLPSQNGWAQWDLSRLRTLGDACAVERTEVENSKLTVTFSRFAAELERTEIEPNANAVQCSVAVGFKVPPQRKIVTLTHRVFAHVNKTAASQVLMQVNMSLNNTLYAFAGRFPEDSVLNQRVLLYKSFAVEDAVAECSSAESEVDVTLSWNVWVQATAARGRAALNLAGDELWTDFWIETRPCNESANTLALRDRGLR